MTPQEIHDNIVRIVQTRGLEEAEYNMLTITPDNAFGIPPGTYVFGRDGMWRIENYCCAMRKHYLIGIVGQRNDEPMPMEAADFVVSWEPKVTLNILYCPFCGQKITADQTMRG